MRAPWREALLAFSSYIVLAVFATWPLAMKATDHVFGDQAGQSVCVGTPNLNVWAIGFVLHQLPRDPIHLFDGNAFYPYKETLAFSEHLFVPALLAAPVSIATGNLVLAYNAMSLMTLALAGLGMYLLARHLTGDSLAAFAAGLLYAFHTFNINELVRVQTLSNQWFPFLLLALIRYFEAPTRRRAAAAGAFYLLQSLSGMYWALYAPILVGPAILFLAWRHRRPAREWLSLLGALAAALVVVAVFAIPYLQTSRELGLERPEPGSIPPALYVSTMPGNLLYGRLLPTGSANEGAAHFPGFVALVLASFALPRRRPGSLPLRGLRPLLIAIGLFGFLMSLGPEIDAAGLSVPGPYALFRTVVPGFRNVRYPERFSLFVVLALCPLLADGLRRIRPRAGRGGLMALASLVFAEHLAIPLNLAYLPTGSAVPAVYRWLAEQNDIGVVAEVPPAGFGAEKLDGIPMYFSTFHWKRTLQGYTGYFPPIYQFVKWQLARFPDPESLDFLERLGVEAVVVSPDDAGRIPDWVAPSGRWDVVGPFPEGHALLKLRATGLARFTPPDAAAPQLSELPRRGWKLEASSPGEKFAVDGDLTTTWNPKPAEIAKRLFLRVRFREPTTVARVSLHFRYRRHTFPTRLEVGGLLPGGESVQLEFDRHAAYEELFRRLLFTPLDPSLSIDFAPRALTELVIREPQHGDEAPDEFEMPWSIAELRMFGPVAAPD